MDLKVSPIITHNFESLTGHALDQSKWPEG